MAKHLLDYASPTVQVEVCPARLSADEAVPFLARALVFARPQCHETESRLAVYGLIASRGTRLAADDSSGFHKPKEIAAAVKGYSRSSCCNRGIVRQRP